MSTPIYKGPGQPTPSAPDGLTGWLGGFLGGAAQPAYKTTPTASAPPAQPASTPVQQRADACEATPIVFDENGDAVIPAGPGPITIVINPRA